jgi:hypothetical protein
MKKLENRLVGQNAFENAVLRGLIEDKLIEFRDPNDLESFEVGDPGETGIMSLAAQWSFGSLDCEVWIETESYCANPECPGFTVAFKWRTAEQEGFWYALDDIFESDETAPSDAISGGPRLITQ